MKIAKTNKKYKLKVNINQSGQTLIMVVLIMILALSIGITTSTRYVRNLRTVTDTDSSSRALTVAEAAIERLLSFPNSTLEDYINFGTCGADCTLSITGTDGVVASATVVLSFLGESDQPFPVDLSPLSTYEVNLSGYPDNEDLTVCWNNPSSGDLPSVSGMYIYGTTSNYQVTNYAYNSIGSIYGSNGFTEATASLGYSNCFVVSGEVDQVALRLKSHYNNVDAVVIPTSGSNLPAQGIRMNSTGVVDNVSRTVSVIKTSPTLPAPFDYVLYSKSTSVPLAN